MSEKLDEMLESEKYAIRIPKRPLGTVRTFEMYDNRLHKTVAKWKEDCFGKIFDEEIFEGYLE